MRERSVQYKIHARVYRVLYLQLAQLQLQLTTNNVYYFPRSTNLRLRRGGVELPPL